MFKTNFVLVIFSRNRLILVSASLGLIINIILWIILWSKFGTSTEHIPLHTNIIVGIDFVASARQVYQLPLAGFGIWLVNLLLARYIFNVEKIYSYLLVIFALIAQLALLISVLVIIAVNN